MRTGPLMALPAAVMGVGLFSSCSSAAPCTTEARYALVVTVLDAAGTASCDARVSVTDGDFSMSLQRLGYSPPCSYVGPTERKGVYTVTARQGTQMATVSNVHVTADRCHVHPQHLALTLR